MLSKSIHCYDSHGAAGPSIVTSVVLLVPAVRWRRDSTIVPSKIVRRPGFVLLCQHAVLARMSEQKDWSAVYMYPGTLARRNSLLTDLGSHTTYQTCMIQRSVLCYDSA